MKGFLAVGGTVALILVSLGALLFFGAGFYLSPQDGLQKSNVIVAISGGETVSRVEEAVKLYREGWAPKIIFSGAALDPTSPSNALVMQRQAIDLGVNANDIFIEEQSATTHQNAKNVSKIIQEEGFRQIILVTSPYHQRRAYLTFKSQLRDVVILNHSAKDHSWRRSRWWENPRSFGLTLAELQKTFFLILGGQPAA